MKKFLIQINIFFIPLILIFIISDYIVTKGLQKTKFSDYKEWNEIYSGSIDAGIIINGSSRAWVHVSPKILDSSLNVNSYNLGIDGHTFLLQNFKFQEYLKYNSYPKIVIQTLDIFTLNKRDDLFNFEQFLPFLYKNDVRKITSKYNGFEKTDYFIPFYRYKNLDIIKIGFLEYFSVSNFINNFKPYLDNKQKGYKGFDNVWDSSFDEFKKNNPYGLSYNIDSNTVELFNQFLLKCKKLNIKVLFVYTPEYIENQELTINRDEIFKIYNDFATKYDIEFLDYSKDTISYQKDYFYNSQHLNKKGSELFTEKLANDIKTKRITYNSR